MYVYIYMHAINMYTLKCVCVCSCQLEYNMLVGKRNVDAWMYAYITYICIYI